MTHRWPIRIAVILVIGFLVIVSQWFPQPSGLPQARSVRELSDLRQVGQMLIQYARKNGEFPVTLDALSASEYLGGEDQWKKYLDATQTIYSRPNSTKPPPDSILLARPTEIGMAIVFSDGSAKMIKRKS